MSFGTWVTAEDDPVISMDHTGEVVDADLLRRADVEDVADGCVLIQQRYQCRHGIGDMAETPALLPGSEDRERGSTEGLADEPGDDHAVVPCLSGSDSVEQADDDGRCVALSPIGVGQDVVHGLRRAVGTSGLERRTEDPIRVLMEWSLGVLSIDL